MSKFRRLKRLAYQEWPYWLPSPPLQGLSAALVSTGNSASRLSLDCSLKSLRPPKPAHPWKATALQSNAASDVRGCEPQQRRRDASRCVATLLRTTLDSRSQTRRNTRPSSSRALLLLPGGSVALPAFHSFAFARRCEFQKLWTYGAVPRQGCGAQST